MVVLADGGGYRWVDHRAEMARIRAGEGGTEPEPVQPTHSPLGFPLDPAAFDRWWDENAARNRVLMDLAAQLKGSARTDVSVARNPTRNPTRRTKYRTNAERTVSHESW